MNGGDPITQQVLRTVGAEAILERFASEETLLLVDNLVKRHPPESTYFGATLPFRIAARWFGSVDAWARIRSYCSERLGDETVSPIFLLELLVELFTPGEKAGAWIGEGVLREREPTLQFDADGLLIGPENSIEFTKEGVLTAQHFVLFDPQVPGVGIQGGFVEAMLAASSANEAGPRPRFAVRTDCLLNREYHADRMTRAYIRGPKGLSIETLQHSRFPKDPSGTVTEHRSLGLDPLERLYPLDRFEIMWSARNERKTVQLEELVTGSSWQRDDAGLICNRYAHAIWNPATAMFEHFDGAVRLYSDVEYPTRLETDLKKLGGRSTGYRKLFRFDAQLDVGVWSDLVVRYYQNNSLALEYLGGANEIDTPIES